MGFRVGVRGWGWGYVVVEEPRLSRDEGAPLRGELAWLGVRARARVMVQA